MIDVWQKRMYTLVQKRVDITRHRTPPLCKKKKSRGDKCLPFVIELGSKCVSTVMMKSLHISSWPYLIEDIRFFLRFFIKTVADANWGAYMEAMVYGLELQYLIL